MGSVFPARKAHVTYRGTTAAGHEVEVRLVMHARKASVTDAWARLTAAYCWVEPTSLEVEIRERSAAVINLPPAAFRPRAMTTSGLPS